MSKITLLGMGAMGSRMAMSLLKSGHEVTVWNRSVGKTSVLEQAGAKVASHPCDAVDNAEFVISMVRDDEASKQVWLDPDTGALAGFPKGAIAIESSTLTLDWIGNLGKEMKARNIEFLDAPVAGTRPQAEAAKLIYFVGGNENTFVKAKPILEAMGSTIHFVGAVGSGMTIKLAVNSLFGIQLSAIGELVGLMRECGLNETKAVEIISSTPVCSPAAKMAAGAMVARKFAPLFPIELVEKDLTYAIEAAKGKNETLPLVSSTQKIFAKAVEQGYGEDNITGIVQLYVS